MPVDEEDAASDFQPSSAQIKGLCSLLASSPRPCNGAVPVSLQEARRSVIMPQTCLLPSLESSGVKAEHLPAAVLTNVESSAAPCGQRARGPHVRRYEALSCPPALGDSKRTLKWNSFVCLWLLVAVLACFSSAVLAFCLHLHSKVKDQSEAVETLINDCRNLHRELDTSKKFVRNQYLSSLPGGEGGDFPGGNLQVKIWLYCFSFLFFSLVFLFVSLVTEHIYHLTFGALRTCIHISSGKPLPRFSTD